MARAQLGQRVRVVIEGEVTWASTVSSAISIRNDSDYFIHQLYVDHVTSIEVTKPNLDQYGPASILWVKVKGVPGTFQVAKVRSSGQEFVYRQVLNLDVFGEDVIEDVTGVDYHAPAINASVVDW